MQKPIYSFILPVERTVFIVASKIKLTSIVDLVERVKSEQIDIPTLLNIG